MKKGGGKERRGKGGWEDQKVRTSHRKSINQDKKEVHERRRYPHP